MLFIFLNELSVKPHEMSGRYILNKSYVQRSIQRSIITDSDYFSPVVHTSPFRPKVKTTSALQ